jgi:predicted alpha/beta hydrolase
MAGRARGRASWKRAGSPSGRKGARKAHPRTRNNYNRWTASDVRALRQLARQNTPMRVIGQKLGRTAISIRGKAQREGISLRPTNQVAYSRRRAR